MALQLRPGIAEIAPYVGGEASLPGVAEPAKLSSNENPLGPSPKAIAAFREASLDLHRYPDGGAERLRAGLARRFGLEAEQIVCGNGSDELIALLTRAYAGPGDEVLFSRHGFLMYRLSTLNPFWLGQFGRVAALAVLFLSFTLVTGEGGMLWLCQVAFAGIGALATAQFATVHGWPMLLAILAGGACAAIIGIVIGLLTIRLGNLYIALVTLTFSLLMERLVFTLHVFAQNGVGYPLQRPSYADTDMSFAFFALAVFAIFSILIVNLRRSTTGLALNAVRWSETASRTMGLSVLQMKLLVSGLAAFVAGVGGGLYSLQSNQALPADYVTLLGLVWLAVLVTFGVRSNIAALLAAFLFTMSSTFNTTVLPDWLDSLGIHLDDTLLSVLPIIGFGIGAILLAKNPEGTVHMQAMSFQRWLQKRGGARAVPAATAFAGRHDPRLAETPAEGDGTDAAPGASSADTAAEVPGG